MEGWDTIKNPFKNENPLWLQIAIGIVIAAIIIGIGNSIENAIVQYRIKSELEAFTKKMDEINQQEKERQLKIKAERALKIERERLAKEKLRIQKLTEQRKLSQIKKAETEEKAAFEAWYQANVPEECKEPSFGEMNVKCINHKIRARREFESKQPQIKKMNTY